ncbi:NADH-cytochrome b5 reductase 2 [Paecilomyces lecythidis]|uniref:NADH-cytochrome b5 reductase 2 n=1 Tax=Paecilomyces lecythidis TaxID=3004212 RepID=A0ABR3X1I8_9EURO
MTKYLEGLEKGDYVEFRGPKGAMRYTNRYSKNIAMIAGGTGITPMYQLIRAICLNPSDKTHINLVYANNSESDILLRAEIDSLVSRFPQKLEVHYVPVNPPSGWHGSVGFITEDWVKRAMVQSSPKSRVMLCGPPPMLAAVKNILSALGFQTPKSVSQMEDEVFVF